MKKKSRRSFLKLLPRPSDTIAGYLVRVEHQPGTTSRDWLSTNSVRVVAILCKISEIKTLSAHPINSFLFYTELLPWCFDPCLIIFCKKILISFCVKLIVVHIDSRLMP